MVAAPAERFLAGAGQQRRWDLALLDPPYDYDGWPELLLDLPAAIAVLEAPKADRAALRLGGGARQALRAHPRGDRADASRSDALTWVLVSANGAQRYGERMTKVLYPGSFDPIHNGHVELIETAAYLFDTVVVATMRNPQKGEPLFDLEERKQMIEESLAHLDNVEVVSFAKLVVDVAKEIGADFIIKGLRSTIDFESEISQAQVNLNVSGVHTLFLPSASANSAVASKYIRDIARFGGDVSSMVPRAGGQAARREVRQLMADRDDLDDLDLAASSPNRGRGRPAPTSSTCSGGSTRWWRRPGRCRCRPR